MRTEPLLPAETASPEETMALGRALARTLRPGDVVALHGALGAGKTHLVKGVCAGLGIPPETVTSPTFTLAQEYAGRLPVYHLDAYRVTDPLELVERGAAAYLDPEEGITLVEWPERIAPLLPRHALHLRLTHLGGNRRRLSWATPPPTDAPTLP